MFKKFEEILNQKAEEIIEEMEQEEQEELKKIFDKAPKIYIDVKKLLACESEEEIIEYFMGDEISPEIVIVLTKPREEKEPKKTLFERYKSNKGKKTGIEKLL